MSDSCITKPETRTQQAFVRSTGATKFFLFFLKGDNVLTQNKMKKKTNRQKRECEGYEQQLDWATVHVGVTNFVKKSKTQSEQSDFAI